MVGRQERLFLVGAHESWASFFLARDFAIVARATTTLIHRPFRPILKIDIRGAVKATGCGFMKGICIIDDPPLPPENDNNFRSSRKKNTLKRKQ